MSSTSSQVLTAVGTALALPNATGRYTNDLTATGCVLYGQPGKADGPPKCVWYWLETLRTEAGHQIGRYRRLLRFKIEGRIPAAASLLARDQAALDLLSDLAIALETDRTLGGLVWDVVVGADVDTSGSERNIPGMPTLRAVLDVYFDVDGAVGV